MDFVTGFAVLWIGLGVVTAILAGAYNRNVVMWLIWGLLFGIFALILVIALPKPDPAQAAQQTGSADAGNKRCPKCSAWVIDWARKCRHCGHAFEL